MEGNGIQKKQEGMGKGRVKGRRMH